MGTTDEVAEFIAGTEYKDLPDEAIRLTKQAFLDCTGVALAGAQEQACKIIKQYVRNQADKPEAIVLGAGFRSSAANAALVNGAMAHALDFDDTNHPLYGHPTSQLMPVVLALAEARSLPASKMITAYLVGFDVEVKLGRALNIAHHLAGWHCTATLGTMGSVVAAAKMMGLNTHQIKMAMAIAASEAGGMRRNNGTMVKPFHSGKAARNGITAAALAEMGFTGAEDILEAEFGFCHVFSGGEVPKMADITRNLGKVWEITLPYGFAIKPYPSCGATHPSIEAMLDLVTGHDIKPENVVQIRVGINDWVTKTLIHHNPQAGLQGKFSMEYCMAVAIVDRKVGLEQFTDEKANSPQVRALIPKVMTYVHPEMAENREWGAIVTVKTADGKEYEKRVDLAKGKVIRPMSEKELLDKFRMCARLSLKAANIELAIRLLQQIEEIEDISELCELLII